MIPETLLNIQSFLKTTKIKLSSIRSDGRINSSINEDEILKYICKKYKIIIPKSRQWFDFAFEEKGIFYPVNIKVTTTDTADNLNCKLGIYYALTGCLPDFSNGINWHDYFEKLKDNLGKIKSRDYYFLVINKNDTNDIILNTLKSIKNLQPNGNNLPFQCKWNENKTPKCRTFEESKQYILSVFGESIKLRADVYFNFKRLFAEYV